MLRSANKGMADNKDSIYFSPDEHEKKKKSSHRRRFADYNDNDDEHINEKNSVNEQIELKTTSDILKEANDPESGRTVIMYFSNIVSFILALLVYYGLLIILFIAFAIHLYDYNYNYEDFVAYWNTKPHSHEFKSAAEAGQMNTEYS
jgi:hypothetical protein